MTDPTDHDPDVGVRADEVGAAGAPPVVEVRDLRVSLSRGGETTEVLHGLDLDIARGEILAVVGESGSGKSVMSLTMMGLLPARSRPAVTGSVRVTGVDMVTARADEQRRVRRESLGVVFQDPMSSLNPTTRVGHQIAEAAGSREEAVRLMRMVGIPQPEQRYPAYPHELSGGLRQRVMIAMAIAGNPALIIADEPTTALDVTVQAQVLRVLRDLRGQLGCSVLLITHDLGVAAQVADRIVVMRQGVIVEQGRTTDVLEHPRHEYTRRLLDARLDLGSGRRRPLPTADGTASVLERKRRDAGSRLLEITEVHCAFTVKDAKGRRAILHALRGVTTDIVAGESLALVGESGSGKSTLLRAIAGLEMRWTGHIDTPGRNDIQMVFQDAGASLTPWLTVEELLTERLRGARTPRAEWRQRIAATLELMGLPEAVLAARPTELSGGQRQRVALARATIVPPKVLLCDEPTSAIDVSLAAQVLDLIHRLRQEYGMTVVFVTHDLGVARYVSDRIAVMYLGRLVETGPVEEVIGNPRHPYTRALVAAVPGAGKELPAHSGEPASPIAPPSGCAYHPRCPIATAECASTTQGTQLVALDSRRPLGSRHELACIVREEVAS
jgi:peptide/nickel transport system ATP-binding protein